MLPSEALRLALALALAVLLSVRGYRRRSLSFDGACAAFFVALEFFLLAFVELGRTLLAETLLCLIGVACVFGAQHTPYVDEDLAVVLYVALAMGAWCFLISAIVWCY